MRIFLPRFHVASVEGNLAALRRDMARASDAGADLALFPEQFLTGYSGVLESSVANAEFATLSALHPSMLCAFGTISAEGHNRQYVFLGGRELAHYDKVHLFRPNGEHEMWMAGKRYVSLEWRGWSIGLLTCNDIRFSEQARQMALGHHVNLMLCPAYWPWQRDNIWRSLLQARAIENCCFVAGCCVARVDRDMEQCDGAGNYVFDPLGTPVLAQGSTYKIDSALLSKVLVDTRTEHVDVKSILHKSAIQ